jgi:methylated-DNA-[protein]-cysteine S-methyltransferase
LRTHIPRIPHIQFIQLIQLIHDSPVGPLTLVADAGKLVGCHFANRPPALPPTSPDAGTPEDAALLDRTRRELDAFFARQSRTFSVPVAPRGTPFQTRVWQALRAIPHGHTVSYGHIARAIGAPTATRAVGAANGRNPICIIIPCHRVVGASGALTGFGGGLPRKRFLLALEHESQLELGLSAPSGPSHLPVQGAG